MRQILQHGRVQLSVRCAGPGVDPAADAHPRLLLLHQLGGSSEDWGELSGLWDGEVFALDFSGHGSSDWLPGRGYSPELFAADADAVLADLAETGDVRVAGAGIGAYVALLLAGARPERIEAALLLPGRGLVGGGALPRPDDRTGRERWLAGIDAPERRPGEPGPDPLVARCDVDVRPVDYAEAFARRARRLWVPDLPESPPWLEACAGARPERAPSDVRAALRALAGA